MSPGPFSGPCPFEELSIVSKDPTQSESTSALRVAPDVPMVAALQSTLPGVSVPLLSLILSIRQGYSDIWIDMLAVSVSTRKLVNVENCRENRIR